MLIEEITPGILVQHILTKEGLIVINKGIEDTLQCRDTKMQYIYCSVFELEPYDVEYHQRMRELFYKKKEKEGGEDYI